MWQDDWARLSPLLCWPNQGGRDDLSWEPGCAGLLSGTGLAELVLGHMCLMMRLGHRELSFSHNPCRAWKTCGTMRSATITTQVISRAKTNSRKPSCTCFM